MGAVSTWLRDLYRTRDFNGTVGFDAFGAGGEPTERNEETQVAKEYKRKKLKLPLAYKPLGFALSWASGALAALAFQTAWKAIRHEEDAPDALDKDRGWGEVLLASALQGAIFAVARSAADRTGAKAVERKTGVWPSAEKDGRD